MDFVRFPFFAPSCMELMFSLKILVISAFHSVVKKKVGLP